MLIIGFHPHLHRHINLGHVCVYLHCQCMEWMRQGNPNKNLQCDYCSFGWRYGLSSTNNKILYLMFWPVMLCMQRGWVVCQSCVNHASFKVDGKCACDDCYTEKSNGSSYYCGVSARRLRTSRKVPKLKLKSTHLLPSCNTDADCNVTYTYGKCKGGVCWHKNYTDTINCRQCNNDHGAWQ